MLQHLINTTLGILSGPGTLYGLRVWMTCQILDLEKKQIPFNGEGYTWLWETWENAGGGGKNDSTRVANLAILSSAQLGRLLVVVWIEGTYMLE